MSLAAADPAVAALLGPELRFIQRDWLSANGVLAFDGHDATLVDTGYVTHADMTRAVLGRHLADSPSGHPARLARVLNTHLHSDHCGGNAALAAEHDCEILVPEACAAAVRDWDEDALTYRGTGQQCPRFAASGSLAPGDRFEAGARTWEIHAAPGHDPTSLIFFAPAQRLLVSADALWENGFGITFPELVDESGFAEQGEVLDLIEKLRPRLVLPGHGPMFADADSAIARARARLAALSADPRRNYRSALRALLKFSMLEFRRCTLDELVERLGDAPLLVGIATRLDLTIEQALAWASDELVRGGQLRREGAVLVDAG